MPDDLELHALNQRARTATTFVEIVDTLVNDFDVIDVLTKLTSRCVELLAAAAAGILLADDGGKLRVIGASSDEVQLLELFQIQNEEGPCLDCYKTGKVVCNADLSSSSPWPRFAAGSVAFGYPSVYAIPLRLNMVTLGCLNLFMAEPVELSASDMDVARALADVASIAIVQNRAIRDAATSDAHLQHALSSRIAIEQAKGMLAEGGGVDMHDAFASLRAFARNNNRGLTEVAEALVAGTLDPDELKCAEGATGTDGTKNPAAPERTPNTKGHRVIRASGELDLTVRNLFFQTCLKTDATVVVIDMSAVTFIDCSGYGGLVAARLVLQERGGSLTLRGATGQPARFLAKLASFECPVAADSGDDEAVTTAQAGPPSPVSIQP